MTSSSCPRCTSDRTSEDVRQGGGHGSACHRTPRAEPHGEARLGGGGAARARHTGAAAQQRARLSMLTAGRWWRCLCLKQDARTIHPLAPAVWGAGSAVAA